MAQKRARVAELSARSKIRLSEDRGAPSEFRLFSSGVNETEKGPFTFDADCAAAVMAFYEDKGVELAIDYEHQSLQTPPIKAPAAGWFTPEIRLDAAGNPELWATAIKWTDIGRAHIEAGEYRYFSPAFSHDDDGRVLRLINFALTNTPAMDGIDALVAASSRPPQEEAMEEEMKALKEQLTALLAQLAAKEEELTALRAKLATEPGEEEVKEEEAEIVEEARALTATLRAVTGKTNLSEQLGAIQGLKSAQEQLTILRAELATVETKSLRTEFTAMLKGAVKDAKIAPAQEAFWETTAKDIGIAKAVSMLRGFVSTAVALVGTTATKQPETGVALSPQAIEVHKRMGHDIEAVRKFNVAALSG